MKKSIPTRWERESEAIIPKNTWEREQEKHNMTIEKKYLENMWCEKEFLDNPPSSCRCNGYYQ